LSVLNQKYAGSRFTFTLAGIDRFPDDDWANGGLEPNFTNNAMKNALHQGTYSTLNLYFLSGLFEKSEFVGFCTFPTPLVRNRFGAVDPIVMKLDGCQIDIAGLPGSTNPSFDLGKLL